MAKRIVEVRVCPGEPTDGSGRVCVHLFVQARDGAFVEPHAMHPTYKDGKQVKQQVECKPTRGRLACDPKRSVVPVTRNSVTTITVRTDDPQAVTCPRCIASLSYKEATDRLERALAPPVVEQIEQK